MNDTLAGRTAVITGGGTGIGASCAHALAAQGANVVVAGRRTEQLDATVYAIRMAGGSAERQVCDVTDREQVEAVVDRATQQFGTLDIVVNSAGVQPHLHPAHLVPAAEFEQSLAINLWGPFHMLGACIPPMLAAGYGRIVNIGSITSVVGMKYQLSYSTAKAALVGMTRTAALDYAESGITVNCICPGGVDTEMRRLSYNEQDLELGAESSTGTPAGRRASPAEIAGLVEYLVGPHGGFTTGAALLIDGGYTVR
jgi:NAD(P)-dependent dehydrogenase (short-subunit alcohol dehydrogenase family)